jgi:hypothetical protein
MTSRKIKYSEYCLFNNDINDIYSKERENNILILNVNYIIQIIDSKRRKLPKCCGCYPVFQNNQDGHMGFHGCLEEEDIFYFSK